MLISMRLIACLLVALAAPAWAQNYSQWVQPDTDGRLVYKVRENVNPGDRIPDFSMVGYGAGLRSIPSDIPTVITINPIAGDNTQHIQDAIDYVSSLPIQPNGFRGAVELGPGQFNVNGTATINTSGVVLRGTGSGGNLAGNTHVISQNRTQPSNNRIPVIDFLGSASGRTYGPQIQIADSRVPLGATSFTVESTAGLSVGHMIEVYRPSTAEWIEELGMDQIPDGKAWNPGGRDLTWHRTITRIEGNTVYVDAPITTAIDAQ